MRMWSVNPSFMCTVHLLGEHRELHMIAGAIKKGMDLRHHMARGLVEPGNVIARHDALVCEMVRRNLNHHSRLEELPLGTLRGQGYVCEAVGIAELRRRCSGCDQLFQFAPYKFLRPLHQCGAACEDRLARDESARPVRANGIARETRRNREPSRREAPPRR